MESIRYQTLRDYHRCFAAKPLYSSRGTKASYSNAGFIVLGLVIEKASGQSYYDYPYVSTYSSRRTWPIRASGRYEDDIANRALALTRLAPGQSPRETAAIGEHAARRRA